MKGKQDDSTQTGQNIASGPDASWGGLYVAGGISSILYILLALVVPAVMIAVPNYDLKLGGHALLGLISAHTTWWMTLQALVLETSILLIVTSAALFFALRHHNKSVSAIGALVLATSLRPPRRRSSRRTTASTRSTRSSLAPAS